MPHLLLFLFQVGICQSFLVVLSLLPHEFTSCRHPPNPIRMLCIRRLSKPPKKTPTFSHESMGDTSDCSSSFCSHPSIYLSPPTRPHEPSEYRRGSWEGYKAAMQDFVKRYITSQSAEKLAARVLTMSNLLTLSPFKQFLSYEGGFGE